MKPRNLGFKFQLNRLNHFDARRDYVFCNCLLPYWISLIMVTITSHNIFQTVHFSAGKFNRDNEKNMSFLQTPKSHKVWKNSEAIGPGSFKRCVARSALFSPTLPHENCKFWYLMKVHTFSLALEILSWNISNYVSCICYEQEAANFHKKKIAVTNS